MNRYSWLLGAVVALAWIAMGCGASGKVDTSKLEKSFQSAPAQSKSAITEAVTAIKAGEFAKAIAPLQKAIKAGGLSEEQKDGIATAITGMQIIASQNPSKYSVEVYSSLSDLVGYLDGREPMMRPPGK